MGELFTKYTPTDDQCKQLYHWADKHKTVVLLNGGNSASLRAIHACLTKFENSGMPFPYAKFHEDAQSLDNTLTAVGIVLPSFIYENAAKLRNSIDKDEMLQILKDDELCLEWEIELMQLLNQFSLAL